MITLEQVKADPSIKTYIRMADAALGELGFTEHSFAHVGKTADVAAYILSTLGYDKREIELAQIAAYMPDIGNVINRIDHAQSGAVMAFRILDRLGADAEDIAKIVAAIGNHDEGTGVPVSAISADPVGRAAGTDGLQLRRLLSVGMDIHPASVAPGQS